MKITMEYKKGILFVRVSGSLTDRNISKFNEDVIPVVLNIGSRNVVINLENLNNIDEKGIDALINISNISKRFDGKSALCNISNTFKKTFFNHNIDDYYLITENELTSLEVCRIC